MSRPRVVITGLGPVSAFGAGIEPLWSALVEGRSGLRHIEAFDPSGFDCRVAGEIPAELIDIKQIVPKSYRKSVKVMCRDIELAIAGAAASIADAGLSTKGTDADAAPTIAPDRFGCHIGAGLIAADPFELGAALVTSRAADGSFDIHDWGRRGMNELTPLWLLKFLPNMLACHVTIIHDCRGPSNTITCAEASAALSLGESVRVIERGAADACLTGGAESKLNPTAFLRQSFSGRLAPTPDDADPATIVRPFAPDANGTVPGEGGALLVVESEASAAARGATPYARVAGFAATQTLGDDPLSPAPRPDDPSLGDAIELALAQAGIGPDDVDAAVPWASGTPGIDAAEAAALRRVFGARAAALPLVCLPPFVGSCAAGHAGLALCVAAKMLREQMLPARLATRGADGLCADAAPAQPAALRRVLVVTTSQGGHNAAIVLERCA